MPPEIVFTFLEDKNGVYKEMTDQTIKYDRGPFNLAYVADDPHGIAHNSFLVVLTCYNGQETTPKLIKFQFYDGFWKISDENVQ